MFFLQRYIYVADILAHEIHVLEKQANMNLTQLKVTFFMHKEDNSLFFIASRVVLYFSNAILRLWEPG